MDANDIIKFVSDGFDKAKAGNALEVYAAVAKIQNSNQLPLKSHYPFGWIIYYALHQSPAYAIKQRKHLLAQYLGLSVTKPHKLHSMILNEAIRLYKDASSLAANPSPATRKNKETTEGFSIVRFINLWDLANLRPGDHRRKEHEGKQLPSTVEKLITQYVDDLYASHTPPSEDFMSLALLALAENPGSDGLNANCARLYELRGNKEKAVELLRNAILASSSKFYLWGRLADIVSEEKSKTRLAVALLYKALRAPGQEDFKGRVHLKMAKVLADGGSPAHAKWELDVVKRMYESKGWNLPKLSKEISRQIPADTVAADPSSIYRKLEYLADDFIYESLPEVAVKKTYHKPADPTKGAGGRTAWRVTDSDGHNYWLQPAKFNIPDNIPLGTPLSIKVFNGKVVAAKLEELLAEVFPSSG